MERELYLAGPFFNAEEIRVIEQMEIECEWAAQYGTPLRYFSPRKHGGNASKQSEVKKYAKSIFDTNAEAIDDCHEIIAVLDRQFVKGQAVYLCRKNEGFDPWEPFKGPLQQPDLGTVWEMGYGFAKHKIVVGFTLRERGAATLNLMLTQSCRVMLYGWGDLRSYLSFFDVNEAIAHFESLNQTGDAFQGDKE